MPYVIQARATPGTDEKRQAIRPEHVAYLDSHLDKLLAAGALLNDDGTSGPGSHFILDTEDRKVAEAFIANDPFTKAGLNQDIRITRWRKGYFDKKKMA